jgi:PIN domain nuclease of toxin-antitoxin system
MRFLLDTHFVLWLPINFREIRTEARKILLNPDNQFVFSVSSIWEIAIKKGLGRPDFPHDPREMRKLLIENGYGELTIESRHVVMVDSMPPIHKDPFDRILIAQAMVEGITLLTADPVIAKYPGPIRKV